MPDTVSSDAALIASLPDNTQGLITAQNFRDFVVTGISWRNGNLSTISATTPTSLTGILTANGTVVSALTFPGTATTFLNGSGAFSAPAGGGGGTASDIVSTLVSAEVSVTAATTLTATSFGKMHNVTGTTADYTVTLPSVTGNAGKIIGLRMGAALTKLITIDAGAGVLIDGQQTRILWSQESAILLCDGTGWVKVAGKTRRIYGRGRRTASTTFFSGTSTTTKIAVGTVISDPSGRAVDVTGGGVVAWRPGTYRVIPNVLVIGNGGNTTDEVDLIINQVPGGTGTSAVVMFRGESMPLTGVGTIPPGDYIATAALNDRFDLSVAFSGNANTAGFAVRSPGQSGTTLSIEEVDPW